MLIFEGVTMLRRVCLTVLTFLVFLACASAYAQTVDTAIMGTVSDNTGAVIRGATVTVVSASTEIEKKAVTAAAGEYSIPYLIPGAYSVTVSASGFKTYEQTGVLLEVNEQAKVNVVLQAGGGNDVVSVNAGEQPLLQSEDASLGTVVGTESAENLPLNGRRFDDLAILTPGVTAYDPDNHTSTEDGASIQAYGSQVTWAQVNIDGVTMVNNRHAYVNLYPSIDAISEFRVYTGDAEAEYGGGAGTVTNIQLRSGTNSFHGAVFDFIRNQDLDARAWSRVAPLPKQVLKQNQFGATLGGPIFKNRTFFFISYEGIRSLQQSAGTSTVLDAAERAGNFAELLPGSTPPAGQTVEQLVSPCTGKAYAGNILPTTNTTTTGCQDSLDKTAMNIINTYTPLPNVVASTYNYSYVSTDNESVDQYLIHLDHKINETNQLGFHFTYAFRNFPTVGSNPYFFTHGTFPIYNTGLQYVHTFSPKLVNELRLGVSLEHQKETGTEYGTSFTTASIGINGFVQPGPTGQLNGAPWPASEAGFPSISISGYLGLGDSIAPDDSRTYQVVDNVTWNRGRHTLIFGVDIRHDQDDADTSNTPFGSISFTGAETAYNQSKVSNETGNGAADFMIGVPASVITPEGVPLTMARQWRDFTYFQDNWKKSKNLTLNLGMRWDLWVPPHDNYGKSETFNWNTSPYPTLVPLPTPLWTVTHKDFSPRVGFAYSLPWKSVVRGGYAISFYGGQFDNLNILQLNPPADPSFSLSNGNCGYCTTPNAPTSTLDYPVSASITPAVANVVTEPNNGNGVTAKHPDLYLQTWNLTISKQFGANVLDVSYVGVKGTHQDTSIPTFNVGPPQAPGGNVQADRPYPHYGSIRLLDYHGASMYNGLNTHFQHRLAYGLELTVSDSWSHLLDNQGSDTNANRSQTQIPDVKEWASGDTDQRNNVTVAFTWLIPKFTGGDAAVRGILNGWRFGAIYQYLSGLPLLVKQSADGENNGNTSYERPDFDYTQSRHVANRTHLQWFNTTAFTEAIGHYGSTTRNFITGTKTDPVTLSVSRNFAVPHQEHQHLELRVEAFNAFNHPQWSSPGVTQGSSSFGKITNAANSRVLQGALKYIF
jgi:hypothetical protein